MNTLRGWIVMSWIMLPGVMVGGSLLLRRLTVGDPDPFQPTWIRASLMARRAGTTPDRTDVPRMILTVRVGRLSRTPRSTSPHQRAEHVLVSYGPDATGDRSGIAPTRRPSGLCTNGLAHSNASGVSNSVGSRSGPNRVIALCARTAVGQRSLRKRIARRFVIAGERRKEGRRYDDDHVDAR
jgi:hypothetical protein